MQGLWLQIAKKEYPHINVGQHADIKAWLRYCKQLSLHWFQEEIDWEKSVFPAEKIPHLNVSISSTCVMGIIMVLISVAGGVDWKPLCWKNMFHHPDCHWHLPNRLCSYWYVPSSLSSMSTPSSQFSLVVDSFETKQLHVPTGSQVSITTWYVFYSVMMK